MGQADTFSLPPNGALLGAYHYSSGTLAPCPNHDDDPDHLAEAEVTLDIWNNAQLLKDAQMIVVKSIDRVSLGSRQGGLIIEGRSKLNIGLVRAATRHLELVKAQSAAATHLKTADRFRRSVWSILQRLNSAVLPRELLFDFSGVRGTIAVRDGNFVFGGDFKNPTEFVQELRAVCSVDDDITYSLQAIAALSDGPVFTLYDLSKEVISVGEPNKFVFDTDGWPLSSAQSADFDTLQTLSLLTTALYRRDKGKGETTAVVYADSRAPVLTASAKPRGEMHFELH